MLDTSCTSGKAFFCYVCYFIDDPSISITDPYRAIYAYDYCPEADLKFSPRTGAMSTINLPYDESGTPVKLVNFLELF